MIRTICTQNYDEMSLQTANKIIQLVNEKKNCTLGLATGSTPIGTYEALIKAYEENRVDFADVTSINLDEYKGLAPTHPNGYRYFMDNTLFRYININPYNTYLPDGLEMDPAKACSEYDHIIEQYGPIDLMLLGIGLNGHIGFNEPADHFSTGTQLVDLTESTIQANVRFFNTLEEVPKQAYTMGIQSIMSARQIVVLASGEAKAQIIHDAFTGPITPFVPASVLRLHPNVTLIGDEAALHLYLNK